MLFDRKVKLGSSGKLASGRSESDTRKKLHINTIIICPQIRLHISGSLNYRASPLPWK